MVIKPRQPTAEGPRGPATWGDQVTEDEYGA